MEPYEKPTLEVITLKQEDVILTSNGIQFPIHEG